jgi:hypothetical protein
MLKLDFQQINYQRQVFLAYEFSSFVAGIDDTFGGSCITDGYAPIGENLLINEIYFGFNQKLDEQS